MQLYIHWLPQGVARKKMASAGLWIIIMRNYSIRFDGHTEFVMNIYIKVETGALKSLHVCRSYMIVVLDCRNKLGNDVESMGLQEPELIPAVKGVTRR